MAISTASFYNASLNLNYRLHMNVVIIAIMCIILIGSKGVHVASGGLIDLNHEQQQMIPNPGAILDQHTGNVDMDNDETDNDNNNEDYHHEADEVNPDSISDVDMDNVYNYNYYNRPDTDTPLMYMKNKRFLGTQARKNWFPSKFRSFVDSDGAFSGSSGPSAMGLWSLPYPEKKHLSLRPQREPMKLTRFKLLSMYSPFFIGPSYLHDRN